MITIGILTYYMWQKHSELKKQMIVTVDNKKLDESDFDTIPQTER